MNGFTPLKDIFGSVIYTYSRREAISDGVLVDVTDQAAEAGFNHPFAVTAAVWSDLQAELEEGESIEGRLWDVLYLAHIYVKVAVLEGRGADDTLMIIVQVGYRVVRYKLHIGCGDTPEPVWTLMLLNED